MRIERETKSVSKRKREKEGEQKKERKESAIERKKIVISKE